MAAAGWFRDPEGSHRLRWWDGERWTTWVSLGGQTWSDPLRGQVPVATVATTPYPQAQPAPYPQAATYPPAYPQAGPPVAPPVGYVYAARSSATERFRSLKGLSVALLVMFIVAALAFVLLSLTLFSRADTVGGLRDGGFVPTEELTAADDGVAGANLFLSMCEISVFVLLVVWLWRAYSNVRAFGVAPRRWGRGWTVGGWFIPLANIVIPKLLINDAWRGADPQAAGNPRWRKRPVAAIVTTWWVLFVIGRAALQVSDGLYGATDEMTPNDLVQIDQFGGVVALLCTTGAILGAIAVWKISRRQHGRAAELGLS